MSQTASLEAFVQRFRGVTPFAVPDVARVFVTISHSATVHEVDPRGPGVWGGIAGWSKHTLCGRRLHANGQRGPRRAEGVRGFTGASCNTCRRRSGPIVIMHALVRWAEAMARRQRAR